jgi:hypothetical protein
MDLDDGWIRGPQSQMLLWVPHEYRNKLWLPRMKLLIGERPIMLDLSMFTHGKHWHECQSRFGGSQFVNT